MTGRGDRPAKTFTYNEQRDQTLCGHCGRRWSMRAFLRGRID